MNPCPKILQQDFLRAHSAVWFPPSGRPRKDCRQGSFIITDRVAKLKRDSCDLICRRSGPTRGIKPRKRNCYCQLLFFPVDTQFRVCGSLILPPLFPSKPDHPHAGRLTICAYFCFSRRARRISRSESRLARLSRLSCSCFPLHRPSCTFTLPARK